MDSDGLFVPPGLAIDALARLHRLSSPYRMRLALIGALRAGEVRWTCERWREVFEDENGATFDENGGWTQEEPRYGWPRQFWRPGLAGGAECWDRSRFTTHCDVNLSTARYEVRRWLESNGGGWARWSATAEDVRVSFDDANAHLRQRGWADWARRATDPDPEGPAGPKRSAHYVAALVNMIARALEDPEAVRTHPLQCLQDAFLALGEPDDADMKKLVTQIRRAIKPADSAPPN